MSESLQERIIRINAEADKVSEKIRASENLLKELYLTKDTEYSFLKWDSKKKRIFYKEKPLIEHSLRDRFREYTALDGLIDCVIMDSEELMKGSS